MTTLIRVCCRRVAAMFGAMILVSTLACESSTALSPPPVQEITATTGSVRLLISTSGSDPDPDGYYTWVDEVGRVDLPPNGSYTLGGLNPGKLTLFLEGLSGNCALDEGQPHTASVRSGTTVDVSFAIRCVPAGSLIVTTVTTGVEPDVNGYGLGMKIDGQRWDTMVPVPSNGTITVPALGAGEYLLTLYDVVPNCTTVIPGPRRVTIAAGSPTRITIEITCVAHTQIAFVRGDSAAAEIYLINTNAIYSGGTRLTSSPGADVNPAWSPDGRRIAFASDRDGDREIYVMDVDGKNVVRLTNSPTPDYQPTWSPDGTHIAFVSERYGFSDLVVMNADGTNQSRLTVNAFASDPAWSPDGSRIAFRSDQRGVHIAIINPDGTGLVDLPSNQQASTQPAWSPDGKQIAYTIGIRGTLRDVWVMNTDGSDRRLLVPVGTVDRAAPDWSPDGRKIAVEEYDCWDYGPCPRGIVIVTTDGAYSMTFNAASEPAWRP